MKSNDINIENQRKFGVRATQVSHGEPGKVYLGQVAGLLQHFLLLILLRRLGPVHKSYLWFLNGFEWLRVSCPFIWNAHFVCFHAIDAGPVSLISSGLGREQAPWCSVTDISVPWARISKGFSHILALLVLCAVRERLRWGSCGEGWLPTAPLVMAVGETQARRYRRWESVEQKH